MIPAYFNDGDLISVPYHREWDKFVLSVTGGMTILKPAKGTWFNEHKKYTETVIPVRIMCEENQLDTQFIETFGAKDNRDKSQIDQIIQFTLSHYRQKAVFYYVVSNNVQIAYCK